MIDRASKPAALGRLSAREEIAESVGACLDRLDELCGKIQQGSEGTLPLLLEHELLSATDFDFLLRLGSRRERLPN